jgi:hypothetical protein
MCDSNEQTLEVRSTVDASLQCQTGAYNFHQTYSYRTDERVNLSSHWMRCPQKSCSSLKNCVKLIIVP